MEENDFKNDEKRMSHFLCVSHTQTNSKIIYTFKYLHLAA